MTVLLVNVLGFFLAYYLSKQIRGRNLMRTIFFMPNVLGGILLGFIWRFIFINVFSAIGKLTNIPFFKLAWLGTSSTGFWALVIVSVWQMAGYLMVIYIAGLSAVPEELIEAAKLDGASEWKVFKNITFPLILPTFTVCAFYTVNHAYKMYDLNYSLTGGDPYRSTESLTMNIISEAFTNNRFGLGTAKAVILFILIAFITGLQYNLTKRREVEM
jgi:raffinose/stachyose/melibiose transport system permease protein